jgi:hypothetical protein
MTDTRDRGGQGPVPEPPNDRAVNREVRNPDAPEDPIEGESEDGLNQETGDGAND